MTDEKFTIEQVKALWPLLYRYWYTNRSLCSRRFLYNILRPRKDKEKRAKHLGRIFVLSQEIERLNKKIEMILHPDEEN